MNIYYTILILLILLSVFEIRDKRVSILFFPLFLLVFWYMGSFRWNTGTDWDSYCDYFVTNHSWSDFLIDGYPFEKGYVLLNYGIKQLSSSYSVFLSICSLINILCFLMVCKKHFRERPLFALLIYFAIFQGGIFVTRQLLATSLCFMSILFIEQKRKKMFFICIFIASLFHITAWAFLLSYYAFYRDVTIKQFFLYLGITIVLSLFVSLGLSFLLEHIPSGRIASKILVYNSDDRVFGAASLIMGVAKRIVTLPLFFYVRRYYNDTVFFKGALNIYLLGTLFYFLFALADLSDFVRFSVPFQLMEIPLLYYSYLSFRKTYIITFIFAFGFFKIYSFLNVYYDLYVPFYTIFDNNLIR